MPTIKDPEFGQVTLRRNRLARNVRLKLDARGVISISLPIRTPLFVAKQLLNDSRTRLRKLLGDIKFSRPAYNDGDLVGKSHTLRFEQVPGNAYNYRLDQNQLIISRPMLAEPTTLAQTIHHGVAKALRVQAKAYLPRRLAELSKRYEFTYQKIRLSSAGTRWGSCSSQGTISLNIWLMQLPFELIDYVIVHELCHTRQMNHSADFWQLVQAICPAYKEHRRTLRKHHPGT